MRWFAYTTHGAANAQMARRPVRPTPNTSTSDYIFLSLITDHSWYPLFMIIYCEYSWAGGYGSHPFVSIPRNSRVSNMWNFFMSNPFLSNAFQSSKVIAFRTSDRLQQAHDKIRMENCHLEWHRSHSKFTWRLRISHAHHSLAVNDDIVRFECLHTTRNE